MFHYSQFSTTASAVRTEFPELPGASRKYVRCVALAQITSAFFFPKWFPNMGRGDV